MGKALKIFIVVNLVMSALVIALGVMSFNSRKLLKAEALELEKATAQISSRLKWGEVVPWEDEGMKKELAFSFSQPTKASELSNLSNELDPLGRYANTRQSQLTQRNDQLIRSRSTLADTRDTLDTRERELATTLKQVTSLTAELERSNAELATAKDTVADLEQSKRSNQQAINTKNNSLTELNNSYASLEIDLDTRIQERDNARSEYERCKLGASGKAQKSQNARGKKGLVLAVNQQWEYVVIEKGDTEVEVDYEAFVHRGNDFVGKLTILRVEDQLAIAEIVRDSLVEGQTIQPGDMLFF